MENKRIVAIVFSALLREKYSHGLNNLKILEILNWPLWPLYLKIHSSLVLNTNEEVNYLCTCCSKALHLFTDLHCKIVAGSLTIKQFQCLEKQKKLIARLCEATSTLKFAEINSSLMRHMSSYDNLMKRVQKLKYFFSRILPYLHIEGRFTSFCYVYICTLLCHKKYFIHIALMISSTVKTCRAIIESRDLTKLQAVCITIIWCNLCCMPLLNMSQNVGRRSNVGMARVKSHVIHVQKAPKLDQKA